MVPLNLHSVFPEQTLSGTVERLFQTRLEPYTSLHKASLRTLFF